MYVYLCVYIYICISFKTYTLRAIRVNLILLAHMCSPSHRHPLPSSRNTERLIYFTIEPLVFHDSKATATRVRLEFRHKPLRRPAVQKVDRRAKVMAVVFL